MTPDGSFGAKTVAALNRFQVENGIRPNGRLDSATLAAIDRKLFALADPAPPAPASTDVPAGRPQVQAPGAPAADAIAEMLSKPLPPAPPVTLAELPVVPATTLVDHGGMVQFTPRTAVRPTSIDDVSKVMRFAAENCRNVKAIGSLHSFSGVQATDDMVVLPQGLSFVDAPQATDDGSLKCGIDPAGPTKLVRVGSGTQLRNLNPALWDMGLALPNMGGYDEQTVAGVVNTATHGSGLEYGPITDIVKSMDMVLPGGRKVRIEPRDGMTDPAAFQKIHPDTDLIQDDDYFHSAVCSMGTMGVVASYVLGVREKFCLDEQRTVTSWSAAKRDLLANGGIYRLNTSTTDWADPESRFPAEHVELLVNPYETNGDHTVVVTTRKDCPEPTDPGFRPGSRDVLYRIAHPDFTRPWASETILDVAAGTVGPTSRDAMTSLPGLAPGMLDTTLKGLAKDKYIERSYNVFNIGAANHVDAFSSEIAIPIGPGDNYVKAIDALIAKAREYKAKGWVETAPFSLRFVKKSSATLAPQQEDACMVEIIFAKGTPHGKEMLEGYQELLAGFGGRPHMGQVNFMTPEKTAQMYGANLGTFNRVRSALDPQGVMRNRFTQQTLDGP